MSKKTEDNARKLIEKYKSALRNPREWDSFYSYLDKFLYILIQKFACDLSTKYNFLDIDDVKQELRSKISEVLRSKDPNDVLRGNLTSYIYMIVRNELSSLRRKLLLRDAVNITDNIEEVYGTVDPYTSSDFNVDTLIFDVSDTLSVDIKHNLLDGVLGRYIKWRR